MWRLIHKVKKRIQNEDGQAYLEFIIGIPILFCLLFLMMDFLAIGHSVSQTTQAAYTNSRENINAGQGLPDQRAPVVYWGRFRQGSLGLPGNAYIQDVTVRWLSATTQLNYFSNQAWVVTTARLRYRPIVMGMFTNYNFNAVDIRGWDYRLNR